MERLCTVLVVDDDVGCQQFLGDFLGILGYRVEVAADGQKALEILESTDHRPCVILLDLMMPVMDGRAFRRRQTSDPALADIPVVVVSAAVRSLQREAEDVKVHEYLKKPFNLNELAAIVNRHCPEPLRGHARLPS